MRTPLNKALTQRTGKEAPSVGTLTRKAEPMNETFRKIAEVAASIEGESPALRAQYLKGIEDAVEAQKAAAQAKEEAETEAAFNKACDDESHARDKEAFFRKMLLKLDFTPRMEEAEYYEHVETVEAIVAKAAADFQKAARKAVDEIVEAKQKYLAIAREADEILATLDAAANVLQSIYRYRIQTYFNAPSIKREDRTEWKRHAIRYINNGKAYDLAIKDSADFAAWRAADLAKQEDK